MHKLGIHDADKQCASIIQEDEGRNEENRHPSQDVAGSRNPRVRGGLRPGAGDRHLEYTGSAKAQALLADWPQQRQYFKFALPLWLAKTQTAEYLSVSMDRKAMIEELSVAYAQRQIAEKLGVSTATIERYLAGRCSIPARSVDHLRGHAPAVSIKNPFAKEDLYSLQRGS